MIIDNRKLKEIYVPKVRPPKGAVCEHFYAVPNAEGYVLSDYGRLYKLGYRWTNKGGYNKVKPHYNIKLHDATYKIRFNGDKMDTEIPIRKLMARVFYPDLEGIHLYEFRTSPWPKLRWSIYNLHVLDSFEEKKAAIFAKVEHREAPYDDSKKGCTFINRFDPGGDFRKVINRTKENMLSRTTNSKVKLKLPIYRDSTADEDFHDDPCAFGQWYLDHWYSYPGQLELDKDILGFGEANHYGSQYMTLVPTYINNIFIRCDSKLGYAIRQKKTSSGDVRYVVNGTNFTFADYAPKSAQCGTYTEALEAARKMKAGYIRSIVRKERSDGYMPDNILEAMEQWAALCELGLIKKWEPSAKTLVEAGVV